ncbi:MAG: hypothetical protein ABI370_13540 [Gammaproteobacteria bacterium]
MFDSNQDKPGCLGILKYTLYGAGAGFQISACGGGLGSIYGYLENPGHKKLMYSIWDQAVFCQTNKQLLIKYLNIKPWATPDYLERCLSTHESEARAKGFMEGFNYSSEHSYVWAYIVPTTILGALTGFGYGLYKQFFSEGNPSPLEQAPDRSNPMGICANVYSMWQKCRKPSNKSESRLDYEGSEMHVPYVPLSRRPKMKVQ